MEAKSQLNNALIVEVGADIPRSAGATSGTLVTTSILADGELVVTDIGGVILDTTTVLQVQEIILVQKATIEGVARLIQTEPIKLQDILTYTGLEYQATVQQVSFIGYNGSSGAFDVINSNNYEINISIRELMGQYAPLYPALFVAYESDATATQAEIANALYGLLAAKVATYNNRRPCIVELIGSAAGAATTDTVTLNFGSTVITGATNIAGVAAVGDYIRVGSQSTVTDELYLIASIVGTTITLAVPFQGPTQTVAIYRGVAATINAGSFGIRVTGIQQPWVLDSRPYSVNMFDVGTAYSATPTSTTVRPYRGNGNYEQIIESQVTYFRSKGQLYNYTEFPPVQPFYTAVTNQDYATLNLSWRRYNNDVTVNPFVGNTLIACALDGNVANTFDTNYTGVATSFVDVLDAFCAQNPALQPQLGNL